MKTLLQNINKMLNEEKTSKEIIELIDRAYRKYNDSYENYLSNVERIVNGNKKLMEELKNIAIYVKMDYKEDIESTKEIEKISFCDKKDKMIRHIEIVITKLIEQKSNKNKPSEIIEDEKIIQRNTSNNIINEEYCKRVTGSMLSEIDSSKKLLISKLSNISKQVDIDYARNEFVNEVALIENNIALELNRQIKDIIDKQDISIANKIYSLYIEYTQRRESDKKLSQREKFLQSLHSEVDEEKAIRSINEKNKLENDRAFDR